MSDEKKWYQSPLSERYASQEMSYLFSPQFKYSTWRSLWIALARAQKTLGVPITEAQIRAMQAFRENIDYAKAEVYETKVRHDVMAHILTFGEQCPEIKGVLHLGATSCFVTDNTDLIQMREALKLVRNKIIQVIRQLADFAKEHAHRPCLSYTHFQVAQPTTVGKRACLWLQDFLIDLHDLNYCLDTLRFLGTKGATGTQSSFLLLFNNDHDKVKKLETLIADEMGFSQTYLISGQTYTRKQDIRILHILSSLAATSHKMATDLRLLSHLKEVEEPFAEKQVGSSAMPYKRNPMRSERVCGLARFLISLHENPLYTAATQWMERTLDDSANRRMVLPEAFLTADGILSLLINVTAHIIVHPQVIRRNLEEELPFLATEHLLMESVKRGKDRQHIHEILRKHSLDAAHRVKEEGKPSDLLEHLANEPELGLSRDEVFEIAQAEHFIGRSAEQVEEFLLQEVNPVLQQNKDIPPCAVSIVI